MRGQTTCRSSTTDRNGPGGGHQGWRTRHALGHVGPRRVRGLEHEQAFVGSLPDLQEDTDGVLAGRDSALVPPAVQSILRPGPRGWCRSSRSSNTSTYSVGGTGGWPMLRVIGPSPAMVGTEMSSAAAAVVGPDRTTSSLTIQCTRTGGMPVPLAVTAGGSGGMAPVSTSGTPVMSSSFGAGAVSVGALQAAPARIRSIKPSTLGAARLRAGRVEPASCCSARIVLVRPLAILTPVPAIRCGDRGGRKRGRCVDPRAPGDVGPPSALR